MFKMKVKYLILVIVLLVVACGPKKGVVTKKNRPKVKTENKTVESKKDISKPVKENSEKIVKPRKRTSVDAYIDTYSDIAISEMRTSKIPASITLAQGILESGSGNGRLAKEANNHFGIKCHGWKGAKIYHDDDKSQECFRKYIAASTSYEDHSKFLVGRKRYAKLFQLKPDDYKGWAKGLRAAGYATDRKYPEKLISLIERYQLYKYDQKVLGKKPESKQDTNIVKSTTHRVIKGDTLYSLSRKYGVTVNILKKKNKLTSNDLSIGQILKIK